MMVVAVGITSDEVRSLASQSPAVRTGRIPGLLKCLVVSGDERLRHRLDTMADLVAGRRVRSPPTPVSFGQSSMATFILWSWTSPTPLAIGSPTRWRSPKSSQVARHRPRGVWLGRKRRRGTVGSSAGSLGVSARGDRQRCLDVALRRGPSGRRSSEEFAVRVMTVRRPVSRPRRWLRSRSRWPGGDEW